MASKTYIFRDRFTLHELFSAAQPHKLMEGNDAIYVVQSSMISTDDGSNVDVGNCTAMGDGSGNAAPAASAGADAGGDGGGEGGSTKVNNIIDTYRLQETSLNKKGLADWCKPFFARVKAELEKSNPSRVEPFMKGAQKFLMEELVKKFDDWCFYINEDHDFEANLVFARYPEGAICPEFFFFRDGLVLTFPGSKQEVSADVAAREGFTI